MAVKDHTSGNIKQHHDLTLYGDGGCEPKNPGGIAVSAWALFDAAGNLLAEEGKVVKDGGPEATNNFAEYCALGLPLRWLLDQGWKGTLRVKMDSQLVICQVLGDWKCKAEHLRKLRQRIWDLMDQLDLHRLGDAEVGLLEGPDGDINPTQRPCYLEWIPREANTHVDELGRQTREAYIHWKRQQKK